MCQICVDVGKVTQERYDEIEAFCEKWPLARYGPGHIALDDLNLLDGHIKACINWARAVLAKDPTLLEDAEDLYVMRLWEDHESDELKATIEFLEYLLSIPEDDR